MASYTDNPQLLDRFNSYVEQQPVNQMLAVGEHKQGLYDQGVQKIQGQLDNIAGLDIVRDVDKQYLHSKMNGLTSNLRTVAAGDFSNFQLVNSVGGMINQIGKDSNIQNAVSSSTWYRQQIKEIQKDEEEGKSNPNNTKKFLKQSSIWMNGRDPGEKLSTSYIKPIDVWSKIKEIAKEVGVDEQTVQQLYQTDEQGKVIYENIIDPTSKKVVGKKPMWNPIAVEKTLKGKDAGKILKAFENGLSSADYQQLAIDGEGDMENYTPEMLKQKVINNSADQIKFSTGKIQDIKIALLEENQKNKKDDNIIKSLNGQLEYFENYSKKLIFSRDKSLAAVDTNPDAVRGSLHTNDYLQEMSKTLSSHDESTKYSISPLATWTMEQNRFNRDLQRDRISDQHWSIEQKFRETNANEASQDKDTELYFKYGIGTPPKNYQQNRKFIKESIPSPNDGASAVKNAMEDDFSKRVTSLNDTNYKITLQYYKEIIPKISGESTEDYELRIMQEISKQATNNKKSINPSSGEINDFTNDFAARQLTKWKTSGDVPFEFRGLIENQNTQAQDVSIQQAKIKRIKDRAIEVANDRGISIVTDEDVKKNIKETSVIVNNQSINLSKQDIIDFAKSHPETFNYFGGISVDKKQEKEKQLATQRLQVKFGYMLKPLEDKLFYEQYVSPEGSTVNLINPSILNTAGFLKSSNYEALAKIESELYLKEGTIKQPISEVVKRGKENKEDKTAQISAVISKYMGDLNESKDFTEEDFQKALLSAKPDAIKVTSYPGISSYSPTVYTLTLTTEDGKHKEVTIDANDYENIMDMAAPVNIPTPRVFEKLNYSGTTNLDGTSNPETAWWGQDDFKNLKGVNYKVTSDLVTDKNDPNQVWMKLYIHEKNKDTKVVTYYPSFVKKDKNSNINYQLDNLPLGINDEVIQQLLNTSK